MKITDELRAAVMREVEGGVQDFLRYIEGLDEIPPEPVHMMVSVEPEALRRLTAA